MKWKSESSKGKSGNARKYYLNEHFFDVIDSEKKAYWLGFLTADGNVEHTSANSKKVSIILKVEDESHLRKFSRDLDSNYPVKIYGDTCHITITSNPLGNALIDLGITPRKSFTVNHCNKIPDHLLRDYYRGLVDGDGCIHKRKDGFFEVGLVGTYDICKSFRDWIVSSGIEVRATVTSIRSFYGFRINGTSLPKKICTLLYKDSNVFLDRKYRLAMEIVNA